MLVVPKVSSAYGLCRQGKEEQSALYKAPNFVGAFYRSTPAGVKLSSLATNESLPKADESGNMHGPPCFKAEVPLDLKQRPKRSKLILCTLPTLPDLRRLRSHWDFPGLPADNLWLPKDRQVFLLSYSI